MDGWILLLAKLLAGASLEDDSGLVMSLTGSVSWLAATCGWRATSELSSGLHSCMGFPSIYIPPQPCPILALLCVSQGLSACSPSAASITVPTTFCTRQQPRPMAQQQQIRYECVQHYMSAMRKTFINKYLRAVCSIKSRR